uniref:basic proline-rich protein-like n=1 Tax=Jaculus jaculus TaxID=51337 RepID=UPI001E1B0A48|nr:basic proline-rich protein-like [Jaculus jaculus]
MEQTANQNPQRQPLCRSPAFKREPKLRSMALNPKVKNSWAPLPCRGVVVEAQAWGFGFQGVQEAHRRAALFLGATAEGVPKGACRKGAPPPPAATCALLGSAVARVQNQDLRAEEVRREATRLPRRTLGPRSLEDQCSRDPRQLPFKPTPPPARPGEVAPASGEEVAGSWARITPSPARPGHRRRPPRSAPPQPASAALGRRSPPDAAAGARVPLPHTERSAQVPRHPAGALVALGRSPGRVTGAQVSAWPPPGRASRPALGSRAQPPPPGRTLLQRAPSATRLATSALARAARPRDSVGPPPPPPVSAPPGPRRAGTRLPLPQHPRTLRHRPDREPRLCP